jgi:hypothetical protein
VLYDLGELAAAQQMAQASLELFEALGDSHYLPDPQLLLARIAGDQGEYATAEALSTLALEQYEARNDVVLTASARLLQAELAWKMGRRSDAAAQFERALALRRTAKRPLPPREQARYAALTAALQGQGFLPQSNP